MLTCLNNITPAPISMSTFEIIIDDGFKMISNYMRLDALEKSTRRGRIYHIMT